jgi:hypothetical protein
LPIKSRNFSQAPFDDLQATLLIHHNLNTATAIFLLITLINITTLGEFTKKAAAANKSSQNASTAFMEMMQSKCKKGKIVLIALKLTIK